MESIITLVSVWEKKQTQASMLAVCHHGLVNTLGKKVKFTYTLLIRGSLQFYV